MPHSFRPNAEQTGGAPRNAAAIPLPASRFGASQRSVRVSHLC
jgi:hypothetical protein